MLTPQSKPCSKASAVLLRSQDVKRAHQGRFLTLDKCTHTQAQYKGGIRGSPPASAMMAHDQTVARTIIHIRSKEYTRNLKHTHTIRRIHTQSEGLQYSTIWLTCIVQTQSENTHNLKNYNTPQSDSQVSYKHILKNTHTIWRTTILHNLTHVYRPPWAFSSDSNSGSILLYGYTLPRSLRRSCTCLDLRVSIGVHVCVSMCAFVLCVCACVCVWACVCVCVCVHLCVCKFVCAHVWPISDSALCRCNDMPYRSPNHHPYPNQLLP